MTADSAPLLTVVRGGPTPEQLAVLVAVVTARASAAAETDTAVVVRPLWSSPVLRSPLSHGPGAWRASGLPR